MPRSILVWNSPLEMDMKFMELFAASHADHDNIDWIVYVPNDRTEPQFVMAADKFRVPYGTFFVRYRY